MLNGNALGPMTDSNIPLRNKIKFTSSNMVKIQTLDDDGKALI